MAEKFRGKYRSESIRHPFWDYSRNGKYFITFCTKDRQPFFGRNKDGIIEYSEIGNLVKKFWMEIPSHFPFVKLGEFVVMPDHFHGIIIIDKNELPVGTPNLGVPTGLSTSTGLSTVDNRKWKPGTVGVIINQFKRICTIHARRIEPEFGWQSRFHDHIIRNDHAFYRISNYIRDNPLKENLKN